MKKNYKRNKVNHELEPIYNKDSKILILGSMPSVKSKEMGFYYAHPTNRFWKILEDVFKTTLGETKEEKIRFLHSNKIALWDVIESCEIVGSSDSSIKNVKANNIKELINETNIRCIFTTGKKATELYKKYCLKDTNIESIYLPSTSPANIGYCSYEKLKNYYSVILKYLN